MLRISGNRVFVVFCIIAFELLQPATVFSQQRKLIKVAPEIKVDSFPLVPGSVKLYNHKMQLITVENYRCNFPMAVIIPSDSLLFNSGMVWIEYQTAPFVILPKLGGIVSNYQYNVNIGNAILSPDNKSDNFADTSAQHISVSGSIVRGVGVGNRQNLVANSAMNLRVSGRLTNDLNLEAYLSDKNTPFQPEGYTQTLQSFDQILVKVYNERRLLQMGDIELMSEDNELLRFNRKVQGVQLENIAINNSLLVRSSATAGLAKGRYRRQQFSGREGVQGPYSLTGGQGETYVMILAGSERVYLDGVLLTRGESNDYIMDYNTAQLNFTASRLISANHRIVVEFEYTDRQFSRVSANASNSLKFGRLLWSIEYANESDLKNQPVDATFSEKEIEVLERFAGREGFVTALNVDSTGFDPDYAMYRMTDSLVGGVIYDSVFIQSFDKNSAVYRVGFAYAGQGKGDYVRQPGIANGNIFRWVAPVNGIQQGSYVPLKQILTPASQQMLVNKLSWKGNKSEMSSELALSHRENNTFYSGKEGKQQGLALLSRGLKQFNAGPGAIKAEMEHHYFSSGFLEFDRILPPEFERDWITSKRNREWEHGLTTAISFSSEVLTKLRLSASALKRQAGYSGFKPGLQLNVGKGGFRISGEASVLKSIDSLSSINFSRQQATVGYSFSKMDLSINYSGENINQKVLLTDSLSAESLSFQQAGTQWSLNGAKGNLLFLRSSLRNDFLPVGNEQKKHRQSLEIGTGTELVFKGSQRLSAILNYRIVQSDTSFLHEIKPKDAFFTGRISHYYKSDNRIVTLSSFYENGTGLEQKRDYTYVEVAVGQGTHVWRDYNLDGVATRDEFELARFSSEGNYIRLLTPSTEFIPVYIQKMNLSLNFDFVHFVNSEAWWKKAASFWGNQFTFRIHQRHNSKSGWHKWVPINIMVPDSLLLGASVNYRNVLSFNRRGEVFSVDWIRTGNTMRSLMINGPEERILNYNELKSRIVVFRVLTLFQELKKEKKSYFSSISSSGDYKIQRYSALLSAQWQPLPVFRLTGSGEVGQNNNMEGSEEVKFLNLGTGIKFSQSGLGIVSLDFTAVYNDLKGLLNSALAYELTDGHEAGKNFLWNLQVSRKAGKYLQINLGYNGRLPAGMRAIHTGQASLTAVF